jgi:chorismate synthase
MDARLHTLPDVRDETGGGISPLVIRPLESEGELLACTTLQEEIWGEGFKDLVPASILYVAQKVGGVAAGAFTEDGALAGFVFGLTGVRDGRLTHWSHMLGVRKEFRGRGIGRLLKRFQRDHLLDRGITEMYWTFDPLVAANAHFNLNVLGVRVVEYVPEMYGNTGSALHDFGTDRLVVRWAFGGGHGTGPAPDPEGFREAPLLNSGAAGENPEGRGGMEGTLSKTRRVRVEIPGDIFRVQREDPREAREWRAATRRAIMTALQRGFEVRALSCDPARERAFYLLERDGREGGTR